MSTTAAATVRNTAASAYVPRDAAEDLVRCVVEEELEAFVAEANKRGQPLPGGEDYGWSISEGNTCNKPPCPEPPVGHTMTVHNDGHPGDGCAVMSGYVHRGCALPGLANSASSRASARPS